MRDPLRLRPATVLDSGRLLEWRNDPRTRAASREPRSIGLEEHIRWLERALQDPDQEILIAEEEGEPVGMVRAEWEGETRKLSWTVAPQARGRGVGRSMVKMMVERIRGPVRVEVKKGNVAFSRMAERAGLSFVREEAGILHYARGALGAR